MENFNINAKELTEMAQKIHNEIDTNGSINEDGIIEVLTDQFAEMFADWAEEHIDWQKIEDDDQDTREFLAEREDALRGDY